MRGSDAKRAHEEGRPSFDDDFRSYGDRTALAAAPAFTHEVHRTCRTARGKVQIVKLSRVMSGAS